MLGLTNYSTDPAASELRACMQSDREAAQLALELVKARLRSMWRVGTFERLRESLAAVAVGMDIDVSSTAYRSNVAHAFSYDGGNDDEQVHCLASKNLVSLIIALAL